MLTTSQAKNFGVLVASLLLSHLAYGQTRAPGLVATYSDGRREVTAVVATPNFSLGRDETIHPQIAPAFSARWHGVIDILLPGRYRVSVRGGALSCRIKEREALDQWIDIEAGSHVVELEFTRRPGAARVQWVWWGSWGRTKLSRYALLTCLPRKSVLRA